jgi:hypothetical protein
LRLSIRTVKDVCDFRAWRCVALAKILVTSARPYTIYVSHLGNTTDQSKLEFSIREEFALEGD